MIECRLTPHKVAALLRYYAYQGITTWEYNSGGSFNPGRISNSHGWSIDAEEGLGAVKAFDQVADEHINDSHPAFEDLSSSG